jgi:(S)-2-hydroxyglutarate dehydrogenase
MFDYSVIGGGIIGLATAMTLCRRHPGVRIVLFERESSLACVYRKLYPR